MSNSKGISTNRNLAYSGKHAFLPPKSPFPSISPNHFDCSFTTIGSTAVQRPREGCNHHHHHQRTSSESFLIEDQPSWVDDLLNEPETPVRRGGHRRSSSDSFAYVDVSNISNLGYAAHDDHNYGNTFSASSWGSQADHIKDGRHSHSYAEANHLKQNKVWDSSQNGTTHPNGMSSAGDGIAALNSGPPSASQEVDRDPPTANEKLDQVEVVADDSKASSEKKSASRAKSSSDTDNKRAKQQFAQRSRVRKLQYIAELEQNVQALQVEGSEVSAEIDFLNQQHLILSMENNALKQRLESLAQEQFIKYFEHEVLEREIGRLRNLYQQQQNQHQQQQPQHQSSSGHKRSKSKDLDVQFANLALNHKDATSSRDAMSGPLRT